MTTEEAKELDPTEISYEQAYAGIDVLRQAITDYDKSEGIHFGIVLIENTVESSLSFKNIEVKNSHMMGDKAQFNILVLHQLLLKKIEQELGPRVVPRLSFS